MFSLRCYNLNAIHAPGITAAFSPGPASLETTSLETMSLETMSLETMSLETERDIRDHSGNKGNVHICPGQMNELQYLSGRLASDTGLGYSFPEKLRL